MNKYLKKAKQFAWKYSTDRKALDYYMDLIFNKGVRLCSEQHKHMEELSKKESELFN